MKKLCILLVLLTGCFTNDKNEPAPNPGPVPTSQPGVNGNDGKSVLVVESEATLEECNTGGVVHTFYKDEDYTNSFTDVDTIMSVSTICNGAKGEDSDVAGPAGASGPSGATGNNGYSLVTQSRTATNVECGGGGTALDVYSDVDYSGTYTVGDTLQNTLVACTGAAGPAGSNGINATASITTISSLTTTCVAAGLVFVRLRTAGSCDVDVYATSPNCSGQLSRVKRLNSSTDEVYWSGSSQLLAVECSPSNDVTVKVINFQ